MRAIHKLGFVQADPIRAPARAQDLTLRHRVIDYHAGELERRYPGLALEEDFFVNYGFLPRAHQALMHPRDARQAWTPARWKQAQAVREFIADRGVAHPREVDAHFAHGKTTNWFGGSSNASTQLLDGMHYRGLLRVAGRVSGTRTYAVREDDGPVEQDGVDARLDALIALIVHKYAPLPDASLGQLVGYLGRVCRSGRPRANRRCCGRGSVCSAPAWRAWTGCGPKPSVPPAAGGRSTTRCGCSPRSTRWSGTAGASRCSGVGRTGSRPIPRRPGASWATTHCRCCGGTGLSAGATWRSRPAPCARSCNTWTGAHPESPHSRQRWKPSWRACASSWRLDR